MVQNLENFLEQQKPKNWFLDFLENHAGKMGKVLLKKNWSSTPLGEIEFWPDSLKSSLSLCFAASDRSIAIYWYEPWNDDFYFFFNDSFEIITRGKKEPLGKYASEVWSEIWSALKIQFKKILEERASLYFENAPFVLDRNGFKEAFFNYNLIPIPLMNGSVGGIFNIAFENTMLFLTERRSKVLKALSTQSIYAKNYAKNAEEAAKLAMKSLADFPEDIPFAFIYLMNKDKQSAYLASSIGISTDDDSPQRHLMIPESISFNQKIPTEIIAQHVIQSTQDKRLQIIDCLNVKMKSNLYGIWPEPIEKAAVLSLIQIHNPDHMEILGVLIIGISPRLELSEAYLEFLKAIALSTEKNIADGGSQELAKDVIYLFQGSFESSEENNEEIQYRYTGIT